MKPWLTALVCVLFLSVAGRAGATVVPHSGGYMGVSTMGHHVLFWVGGSEVLHFHFGHLRMAPSMDINHNGSAFYRNTYVQITCHWSTPTHVHGTVVALGSGMIYHWSAHLYETPNHEPFPAH